MLNAPHLAQLDADGFTIVRGVLDAPQLDSLRAALVEFVETVGTVRAKSSNARRLLECCEAVRRLAASRSVRELVEPVLGSAAFAVRGLLFDKVESANWRVGWHQDLMIPVEQRVDAPGYSAWSIKQGVVHVRPPEEVLAAMLTLRVHVDDCPADNGPLEVLPGTHRLGIVPESDVRSTADEHQAIACTAAAGDVLVMRPLLLHASRPAGTPRHRRVVHLEFASEALPGGVEWRRESNTTA
ncbi:phytanoyl-CoA dioxygenase family protein [Aeoliella sp.]|uniref:phytanoyl-CoA dioxygenase family protein n=1 Tax=Aeoliella sp. TaxID=2795800 RepID=UPI003CCC21DE